jgi:hypothetical protein
MGRGRQKAKATKQAREMKYFTPNTDYTALQRELAASKSSVSSRYPEEPAEPDYSAYEDKYADQFDDEDEDTRRIG